MCLFERKTLFEVIALLIANLEILCAPQLIESSYGPIGCKYSRWGQVVQDFPAKIGVNFVVSGV